MPFAVVSGARLHYEVLGEGEPLVLIAGTSFDLTFWEPMLEGMRGFRVLRLDNRGAGLSDPPTGRLSIRGMADDVAAVMAAAGFDAAHVYGASMGSLIAQELAIRHPDRVLSLVLGATSTGGTMIPSLRLLPFVLSPFTDDPETTFKAVSKLLSFSSHELGESYPGHGLSTRDRKVLRQQLMAQVAYTSLPRLRWIRSPALVLHGENDRLIPPVNARVVARLIPRARLKLVPGAGHLFHRDAPHEADQAVQRFLMEAASELLDQRELGVASDSTRVAYSRENATLLFTDIENSTAHLVRVGDDAWTRVLDEHNRIVADLVATYGGHLVKHTGDGVLAVFAEASCGVACARELILEVGRLGIIVRTGLHTGECLIAEGDVCGLTVHVAARVAALARGGEVRVSQVTHDLVAGTIGEFVDCGPQLLKGLPGEWPLFALPVASDHASAAVQLA